MVLPKRPISKKGLLPLLGLAVVFVAIVGLWAIGNNKNTPQFPASVNSSDTKPNPNTNDGDADVKTDSVSDQTTDNIESSASGRILIETLNQTHGYVNVKATVEQFKVNKCVYEFTSDGARPVIRETPDDCQGISINQMEFEKIGPYLLTVTAYGETGKLTDSQTINIK